MAFVDRSVHRERRRDGETDDRERLVEPLPERPGSAWVGALDVTGEPLESGLGREGVVAVVGGAHLLRHCRCKIFRQMPFYVADLVQLTPLHDRVVEYGVHG